MSKTHYDRAQEALLAEYRGKSLSSIRTPAVIIDVATFKKNAQAMKDRTEAAGVLFRCVLRYMTFKSHLTPA
jgi:D-serine deaminase-like pyridoxal phosphate-dependent protein